MGEIGDKTEKIAEKGRQSLLENYQTPHTSIEFETDLQAFQSDYKMAYKYLMKTNPKVIE